MNDLLDNWIYETSHDNHARYVLGECGDNPLFCIGVNPSTAEPNKLDNTLRSVKAWAKRLGFDSWVMLNLYPQRATNPKDLDEDFHSYLHRQNQKWIYTTLGSGYISQRTIWAAWGTLIEKRYYLKDCLKAIVDTSIVNHKWITIGKRSNAGHPHHPLYLDKNSKAESFDVEQYMRGLP